VTETRFGLIYQTGYRNLQPVTATTPRSPYGNKWYTLNYPLANIDNLWEDDISFLRAQWTANDQKSTSDALWKRVYSYLVKEQKSVYKLLPEMSVIGGRGGQRLHNQGQYDFGAYLRVVEIRVNRTRTADFENFVRTNVVPAVAKFLPEKRDDQPDRLPRFYRTVKIEVNMGREPEFFEFIKTHLMAAAEKAKIDVFFYQTLYGGGANFFMIFPFEDEKALANTRGRVLQALWKSAHSAREAQRLDAQFGKLIIGVEEMVHQVRRDMSSRLDNKYLAWQ
jgi:hypothetical protein